MDNFINTAGAYDEALLQYNRGNLDAAKAICRAVAYRVPPIPDFLHLFGLIAFQKGRLKSAITHVGKALDIDADNPNYLNTLSVFYKSAGKFDEAVSCLKKAISIQPEFPEAYNNLGLLLQQYGDGAGALTCYRKAIKLAPGFSEANYNLGILLKQSGRLDEAMSAFERTIQLQANHASAFNNLAGIQMLKGNVDGAIENYRKAISIKPQYAIARMNLAMALLLIGDLPEGWKAYEWRFMIGRKAGIYPYRYNKPRWDGTNFCGKTLLIHDEQGFGDTLQFVRYLPWVKAQGGRILFETRAPLIPLLNRMPGIDEIVERSEDARNESEFDIFLPLLSLPLIFGTTLQTIPQKTPYITADEERSDYWRKRIGKMGYRVGIVWAGSRTHHRDKERSIPLEMLISLTHIPNTKFYGLQKPSPPDKMIRMPGNMEIDNIGNDLEDFSDTAAVIHNLDLVISVDTAVAHLAGAMGKNVWTLLSYSSDWRWGRKGHTSPWYPTMTLFRQQTRGDWQAVVDHLGRALSETAGETSITGI